MRRLIPLLLLLTACGSEPAPSAPAANATSTTATAAAPAPLPSTTAARPLIASSAPLGDLEFTNAAYTLPTTRSMMNDPARAAAKALQRGGWTAMKGETLVLTDKGTNDRRFLLRPNGSLDVVPLAKKELGEVTGVRATTAGEAEADFTWRWVPNELGTLLAPERFAAEQRATATLLWDGSKWTVLTVVKRP